MLQIVNIFPQPKGCVHPHGHPVGLQAGSIEALFANLPAVLEMLGAQNFENAFYTLGHHTPLGQKKPTRLTSSFDYQTVFPFDIDYADRARWYDYAVAVAKVLRISGPESLVVVWTGNGLHVLAHLKHPIRSAKQMREFKPAYNEICRKLLAEMAALGLPGKPDPVVWEAARVFRLPGTINSKPSKENTAIFEKKACELLQNAATVQYHDLDIHALAGLDKLAKENVSAEEIRRTYPLPDFSEMVKECRFIIECMEHPEKLHEPNLHDLFSLLAVQAPGKKITFREKEYNSRELAEYVWNHASSSKSAAAQSFDRKWEEATRYGARKCSTINQNYIGVCQTCPHNSRIPTPLALKSREHISSQEVGFWVHGKNGQHLHPYYSDLAKIYGAENPFITTPTERIFVFDSKAYRKLAPLMVKAWLERKMVPSDPLVMNHRNEFLQKILVTGAVSEETEKHLFTETIRGKLNCANGVVDIVTGQLHPHSHTYGFQYCLPYEYHEGESSEFFLDWLANVMMDRTELMDSVLDIMAYCLWPSYDNHLFTYFTGEGANGKGTLLAIIQALVGKENTSSVSLSQLATNRFAPSQLEGKLVNLVGESSGNKLSYEEMNVIKDLSGGGTIYTEKKGKDGFELENKTKLIFAANKTPIFADQGHAIKRRLLAIPFDQTFKIEDPRIQQRLIAEVPAICSMLVKRIQENVKLNGRFVVSRGGEAAAENQERILLAGNSVVEWARESLESSVDLGEESIVSAQEAFTKYSQWCVENNFKPMNKTQYGHFITKAFLTPAAGKSALKKIGGKVTRVYPYTKWKEEVIQ